MPIAYALKKNGLYLSGLFPTAKFEEDVPRFNFTYLYLTEEIARSVGYKLEADVIRCEYTPKADGTLCGALAVFALQWQWIGRFGRIHFWQLGSANPKHHTFNCTNSKLHSPGNSAGYAKLEALKRMKNVPVNEILLTD